jgi:serine palmitoyltransferase
MGTFTKSFGAAGGYIAGSKEVIDRLRIRSHAMAYAEAMSPLVMTQIVASMASIMGVSPPLASAVPQGHLPAYLDPAHRSVSESVLEMNEVQLAHTPGPAVYGPAPSVILPAWLHLSPSLLNGTEGRERLRRLAFNSRYLSGALRKMGFIVYGHRDSPIVPMLLYNPAKMPMFSRMMLDRFGKDKTPIVVVVVAYP